MNSNIAGVRRVLTDLCRHRYSWPDYSCMTLVAEMAVARGWPRPDTAPWSEAESEVAAVKEAIRRDGSVPAAFARCVAEAGPWVRRDCDRHTPCHVRPGDVVLLRAGLRTQSVFRTVSHHVGLIGPEGRPWVWTPPRPVPLTDAWGPPLVHMHLLGADD